MVEEEEEFAEEEEASTNTASAHGKKRVKGKKDDVYNPDEMDLSVISKPLLERMADTGDDVPIPTVIDLNFTFREGLPAAKTHVCDQLKKLLGPDDCETAVDKRKTRLAPQFVFANLTAQIIRKLAALAYQNGTQGSPGDAAFANRAIFLIWLDFKLEAHITRSVATVKVDAATRSFSASGENVVWAVVDSGIDRNHLHFEKHENLKLKPTDLPIRHMDFTRNWGDDAAKDEEAAALTDEYGHGTHVAGIIAGEYDNNNDTVAITRIKRRDEYGDPEYSKNTIRTLKGMAPKCRLVSFKVLDEEGEGDVSNIIAALAQIQEINEHGRFIRIHGVNLSVGYPFNPEWFACGKSPLCVEVDRLVRSGVVVVVSAGNSGYGTKQTEMTKVIRAGMMMTINDPGNARLAITVGATHRDKPHEFGPSFFSSKGPTGDGRFKPDILAPGERILSCGAGAKARARTTDNAEMKRLYVDDSGTSMAAPHVSGAMAAFLSVRREFIGEPERLKQIFMDTATDLGRDRYMQGTGLLDLMRAMQSV
ncbi:Subtilisin DY [Pelagimonas phthalicica]|uniref:Subtilisin DY n=1 Tax=Pelagimonas phthalicica TaxID=1037362 RepID=A0A238JC06_9RHOB|nr:S8 family peptidase [Pelagimonas phthalicica]TDS91151.1 subtilase family protein [Pelagimonas phthalicica]SMX28198.1 Subtilisin DY [Pelagimonas phthalicica]